VTPAPHRVLAGFAAFVAISAIGPAIGLIAGAFDFGETVNHRLPLHSPVLAGIALAIVVGVPSTVVALFAWRGSAGTRSVTLVAGWLLIGWIAVEIAFIREFSFLQVVYGAVGILYVVVAGRLEPSSRTQT
jgi:hypothetical protein